MPTITLNRKVFEKLVGSKLSEEKLVDRITYLGASVEEITADEIKLEIEPNRPDWLSEQGFARAFSSFIGKKTGLKNYKIIPSGQKLTLERSLQGIREHTACAIVKGLTFDGEKIRELIQIQEKLHVSFGRNRKRVAIGIYPLEHITMPITFKALEPKKIKFQPLEHSRELDANQILAQHPAGREYAHLLEGLKKYPLFVDAKNKVLSMPPIINSHDTGKISTSTKEVFIECSGHHFESLSQALNILVTTMAEMGGQVYSMTLYYPGGKKVTTPNLKPTEQKVDINYINKLLGLQLTEAQTKKLLERMGFGYNNKKAQVPAYRADVLHMVDLAEDIAIAYGYENFDEIIPNVATLAQEDGFEVFKKRVANLLAGLGFIETNTFCITSKHKQTKKTNTKLELVELANSFSADYDVLRAWMLPSLLDVLEHNKSRELPHKIFETNYCFKKNTKTETGVEEFQRLAVLISDHNADYTKIRQVLDYLLNALSLKAEMIEAEHPTFIPGRVARASVNNKKIAYIGEVNPQTLNNYELDSPVAALELNMTELYQILQKAL
ncbi:phenylalanine--tRNA ligase subunit beta [Candidatus Woesearchaeota archaeon]|nr:phenylalanine--tRNA ligase subunit beta [Candidatus Woesearchaeota archaeon]